MAKPSLASPKASRPIGPPNEKAKEQPTTPVRPGIGMGIGKAKRHRRILRDSIMGVTRGDIRRLARRGGVKRISASIYQEVRVQLRIYLHTMLKDIAAILQLVNRKTVFTSDVVFVLNRQGRTIYGFSELAVQ